MSATMTRETARRQQFEIHGLMGRMKHYFALTRAERRLQQLDDRLLSDIGLNRAEIGRSVWGA
jgi:uncharacterized protein YjiS (DUF1127 family)